MKSNILLVLVHQPLTHHNFTRLGVNTKYKNWRIIYWSILPLINKKIYLEFIKKEADIKDIKTSKKLCLLLIYLKN